MDNHAPAIAGAQIDIGYRDRDRRTALALYADIFLQAVHRDHHAGKHGLVRQPHPDALARSHDLRPGRAHRVVTNQPLAARMHADDVFVLGPHFHHGVQVAALQRFVKRGLGILRRGESGFFHDKAW